MKQFFKWTAVSAAVVVGGSFVYAFVMGVRQRVEEGLATAEQVADDASRVLSSTQQALNETQRAVHHLRTSVS